MELRTLTGSTPTRWLAVGLVVLLAAALLVPALALAAGGSFTDDDRSIFEGDIEWLAWSGVTRGCNPPANTRFCPEDDVTRGEMAAFMRRFAQFLGAEDGVVDRADHAAAATTATVALTAANATTLHGYRAIDMVQVSWCMEDDAPDGAEFSCDMYLNVGVRSGLAVNASAETWAMFAPGWDLFSCELLLDGQAIPGSRRDVTVNFDDGGRESNCTTNAGLWIEPGTHHVTFRIYNVEPSTGIKGVSVNGVATPIVPIDAILMTGDDPSSIGAGPAASD